MKTKKIICILISLIVLLTSFSVTAYANAAQKNKTSISISKKSVTLTKGKTYKLKMKNANAKKVKWSSKNKKVATVKNGRITAKSVGKTTIIAKYKKKTYKCKVTVKAKKKPTTTKKETTTNQGKKKESTTSSETTTNTTTTSTTSTTQSTNEPVSETTTQETSEVTSESTSDLPQQEKSLKLMVDGQEIDVIWEENASVNALKEMAESGDIVINLSKYGGFEQFGEIGKTLPSNDKRITTKPGDIILYNSDSVVMFYGSNTWSYTRLGKVQGMSDEELTDLLGNKDVIITICMR